MTGICYFCSAPATSDEHVPPKTLFPKQKDSLDGKDYRKNLLTVRSCDLHNTNKSKEDEYLLYVLAMSSPSNRIGTKQFLTKVQRAINRRPMLLDKMLIGYQLVICQNTSSGTLYNSIALKPDENRLNAVFECIARALYFIEKGAPWNRNITVLTEFMMSLDDKSKNERQSLYISEIESFLMEAPFKGENPEVFSYQFVERDGFGLMRLYFYEKLKVSATFIPN